VTNSDLSNITQKTKDRATRTRLGLTQVLRKVKIITGKGGYKEQDRLPCNGPQRPTTPSLLR